MSTQRDRNRIWSFVVLSVQPNAVVEVKVAGGSTVRIGNAERLSIIAGPCALESRQHALEMAHALKEIAARLDVGLIFKTSFDKANRTSAAGARGDRPAGPDRRARD